MTSWTAVIALRLADYYIAASLLLLIVLALMLALRQPSRRLPVGWATILGVSAASCPRSKRASALASPFPITSVVPSMAGTRTTKAGLSRAKKCPSIPARGCSGSPTWNSPRSQRATSTMLLYTVTPAASTSDTS